MIASPDTDPKTLVGRTLNRAGQIWTIARAWHGTSARPWGIALELSRPGSAGTFEGIRYGEALPREEADRG